MSGTDGYVYERSAITEWLQQNPSSPMTRQAMVVEDLTPDANMQINIWYFLGGLPAAVAEQQRLASAPGL